MSKFFSSILLALPFFLTMTACTPSDDGPKNTDTERVQYLGDLDKKLNELYAPANEPDFDPCDFQNRAKILEIARVLEQKRSEIEAFGKNLPAGPEMTYLDIGPFKFRDDRSKKIGENTWEKFEYGWNEVITDFEIIKDWPVDKYWFSLNSRARAIVMDDISRIYYYQFMSASRENGPKILEIDAILQACVADSQCLNPALSSEQKAFLSTNVLFKDYFYRLSLSSVSNEKKREKITRMADRIHGDTDKFGFYQNPLV